MNDQDLPSEVVRYELRGPVAWVTIDRPAARNALNRAVRDGLFAATERFNADPAASGDGADRRG